MLAGWCASMWKIEHRAYRLPFRQTVRTAHGPWSEREGWLIRVVDHEEATHAEKTGVAPRVGWGEAAPIPWFGTENFDEAAKPLENLGGAATDVADALARVPADCPCVRAGLAAAFAELDEVASAEGGRTTKFIPVAGLLPAGRAALDAVAARLELGFRTFKWKVGVGDARDEQAILDDLLGELPGSAKLRIDANGAWERRVAERWLALAAERPMVEYVEQPVSTESRGGEELLRGLADDFPVTLALDESVAGARDVEKWLAADWRGVWVVKPALLGEPGPILAKLAAAGADLVFGSALETAVGARAGLRLAFSWADARAAAGATAKPRALGYGVWPLFQDARADAPLIGPFVRREDLARINPEALWNALS